MHARVFDRRIEPRLDRRGEAIIPDIGPRAALEIVDLSLSGVSLVGLALPALADSFGLVLGLEEVGWIEARAQLVWRRDAGDFTQLGARLRPRRLLDQTRYERALSRAAAWPCDDACVAS